MSNISGFTEHHTNSDYMYSASPRFSNFFFISAYLSLQALPRMAVLHQTRVALLYTTHFVGMEYAR